jgi:uncharacterized membrane protein
MERMRETIPFPSRPANAIALALVTVLALLLAPVCAPLCAAKACSSGATEEQCYGMASMGAVGGAQFVAVSKACRAPELSAVLLKADDKSSSLQNIRNVPAPIPFTGAPAERLGGLHASSEDLSVHRVPLELSDSLLLTTILRI